MGSRAFSVWTAERIAARLAALSDEHGAPNFFRLSEVSGDSGRVANLAVSRIARWHLAELNRHLARRRLAALYHQRTPTSPASIEINVQESSHAQQ
jgi:hypothetical protein